MSSLKFSVLSLRLRPFDPTSPVAHEFPGISHFDTSLCHLVNPRTRGLAILLGLANEMYFRNPPRGFYADLTVSLHDPSVGTTLASVTTRIHMSRYECDAALRIDLPLKGSLLADGHPYNVTVEHSGVILASKEVRFYNPFRIGRPPVQWVYPLSGSAKLVTSAIGAHQTAGHRAEVVFTVENKLPVTIALPTLQLYLTAPDDTVTIHDAAINRIGSTPSERICVVNEFNLRQRGVYYAELRCMGYPVAGLLFSTDAGSVRQAKKSLFPRPGDSYKERLQRFERLVKRGARRDDSSSNSVIIPFHSSVRYMSI